MRSPITFFIMATPQPSQNTKKRQIQIFSLVALALTIGIIGGILRSQSPATSNSTNTSENTPANIPENTHPIQPTGYGTITIKAPEPFGGFLDVRGSDNTLLEETEVINSDAGHSAGLYGFGETFYLEYIAYSSIGRRKVYTTTVTFENGWIWNITEGDLIGTLLQ